MDILTVDQDLAGLDIDEPLRELDQGRFAGTRGTDERNMLAGRDTQPEAPEERPIAGVSEMDVLERNAAADRRQLRGAGPVDHLVILADDLNRIGDAGDELRGIDEPKGKIAGAVQNAEGDRHRQNHIARA